MSKNTKKRKFKLGIDLRMESQSTSATIILYVIRLAILIISLKRAWKSLS